MKKLIVILLIIDIIVTIFFIVKITNNCQAAEVNMVGDPLITGWFHAPTGEYISWVWLGGSLGVMDTNGKCVWNNGEPRECTFTEFSIMLYYLHTE
jgi:hypothetical protein